MSTVTSRHPVPQAFEPSLDGYPNGHNKLLILGPPGTGKTRQVLDAFIEPAMCLGIEAESILSCSFTRAAARELRERLSKSTGLHDFRLMETCATIHSEALRRFRKQFGTKGYSIIGEKKNHNDDDDEGPPARFEESLPEGFEIKDQALAISVWNLARNRLIFDHNSQEFKELVYTFDAKANLPDIRNWVGIYEQNKKDKKLLDFTDILIHGLRCTPPDRELVIVDEAQDCSMLQWKLVEKWAAKAKRVVFVGDFDQTLYEWNGAYPDRLFGILNEGFVARRLAKSYRVPAKIHTLARSVIVRNNNRIDAPYEPMEREGSATTLSMRVAVEELADNSTNGKTSFVLARSAKILDGWVEALSVKGIPFVNERGKSPWGSPVALSVVRAIIAIREGKEMKATDARRLVEQFPGRHPDYFNKKVTKKATVTSLTEWVKGSVIASDLEELGLKLEKIKTEQFEPLLKELDLKERAETLARLIERNGPDVLNKTPLIVLTTMHGAKGREKDLVVVEMEAPKATCIAMRKDHDGSKVEAERRLCYVAFTRAKESLILCRPGGYDLGVIVGMGYPDERKRQASFTP